MKKLVYTAALLPLMALFSPMSALADDVSVSVSVDAVSDYVFRGVSFQQTALQPGVEVSKNGFTIGAWSSLAIGESSAAAIDEFDVYGGYSWSLNDAVDASVGFTLYHFPDTPGGLFDFGDASTFEINAGASFNTFLAPSITAYYDFDLEAFTLEGGVSHSVPVAEKTSLDLGLSAGLVSADGGGDYEYAAASAGLGYALTDTTAVSLGANYSLSSFDSLSFETDTAGSGFTSKDNLLWFGVGISSGF